MRLAIFLLFTAMTGVLLAQQPAAKPLPPAEFISGTIERIDAEKGELTIRTLAPAAKGASFSSLTLYAGDCKLVFGFQANVQRPGLPLPRSTIYVEIPPTRVPIGFGSPLDLKTLRVGQAVEVSVRGYQTTFVPVDQPLDAAKPLRRATYLAILPDKPAPPLRPVAPAE